MEIIEIKKQALLFDKTELSKLKYLIDYCYHRANKHTSPISDVSSKEFIDYLRANLNNVGGGVKNGSEI